MRLHSIRVQMISPIALLAVIIAGFLLLMIFMSRVQQEAMRRQAENYFEAVSVVLNADRDIYQALIAQERLMSGDGNATENQKDFDTNAQQVFDRFGSFRRFLAEEPQLIEPFGNFDQLYKEWLDASKSLNSSFKTGKVLSEALQKQDERFQEIRDMLDDAGERLRQHTQYKSTQPNNGVDLQQYVEALSEVLNADRDIYQARLSLQKMAAGSGSTVENRAFFEENVQQALQRFHNYRSYLIREPELTKPYDHFDTLFGEWIVKSRAILESSNSKSQGVLPQAKVTADERFKAIRDVLDKAGETVNVHAREQKEDVKERVSTYEKIAIAVIAIAFLLALVVGYYVPLIITRNVQNITRRIREIAEGDGDLTLRINSKSRDELGDLSREFDSFVEHLREIMSAIQKQSVMLGGMTGQLNTVSEEAGRISEQMVSSSNSMVSTGNDMSSSNQQMAGLAKGTAAEANLSSQLTYQGKNAVNISNQAIERLVVDIELALKSSTDLEQSSAAIVSILEVIRKIAEQTNLLALNAAIEAARAGEQGRGFAVVADEVRMLATRTQDSTREIETMIERLKMSVSESTAAIRNSRNNADTTVAQINQVTEIFDTLSASFDKVQHMATQTALTTDEQAQASLNISENINLLKEQTDGVSRMSDEVQGQAKKITVLYQELRVQVESFKV
ncbi:methyl-accepting chemotaxis protein [Pseudomonas sp. DOAB1067]|uniref:Methyl-accepting chemotaxis protein n=1 Tax=Pseudomonas triticifolii TaxID=2762592 RepID=A0ABR7BA12_9PSED|nr:methyl-accepting chemotaxis protein [Pseudomonas triticifolii]MBC3953989.1 methyl-accepting chemotaxis protein [Pseudomonas triticifolii]